MEDLLLEKIYQEFLKSSGVSIDSRTIGANQLFFAIKGDRVDGHDFIPQVVEKNVCCIICNRWNENLKFENVIIVSDPLKALQELAKKYIANLSIPILAITGSNGKTTNKELISAVLSRKYRLHRTPGNYNNHIGLPLTVLNTPKDCEFLVLEMGTNHFGEIAFLCKIGQPTFGVIINIGKSHLEFLGDERGVLKAKSELADYLAETGGLLFVNSDEGTTKPLLEHPVKKQLIGMGGELSDQFVISEYVDSQNPMIALKVKDEKTKEETIISSNLVGAHNVKNLVNAISIGIYFGIPVEEVNAAISTFRSGNNRSQLLKWKDNQVYLDAYNANPSSMRAALSAFNTLYKENKVYILGEMGELGPTSHQEHRELMQLLSGEEESILVFVGTAFLNNKEDIKNTNVFFYEDIEQLRSDVGLMAKFRCKNIFIKGSRFLKLENLLTDR